MEASIVIATFNTEKFIGRAIRSCIEQTSPCEIIVVDDGSTDDTQKILKAFGDRIIVITLKKNRGLPHARNIGIRKASCKYVMMLDADDFISQDCVHTLALYLNMNKKADAVACDYYTVSEGEEVIERIVARQQPIDCGVMYRKDKLIDIGLYDEQLMYHSDKDLRDRFLQHHDMSYLAMPFYKYRRHKDNQTNQTEKKKWK